MDHRVPSFDLYGVPRTSEFHGMPFRYVGNSGLRAPAIGLGTWKFGYPETGDGARVDLRTALAIFDRAIELGVTFWDTANRYNAASGNSERVIGQWLASNPDQRRNVIVATKIGGGMDGVTPNHSGLSRTNIIESVRASLARLQLEYVDLLWFHSLDSQVPIEESLETIEDLVRDGAVRYFAISNATAEQLRAYLSAAGSLSRRCRPIAVQNQYDPLDGEPERFRGVLDLCAEQGVAYVPWSPLARGLLTGRYLDPAAVGTGDRLFDEGQFDAAALSAKLDVVRRLAALAAQWGVEVSQLALAYLLAIPGMGPQIPGTSTVAQLESNAAAGMVTLDDDRMVAVQAALAGK